MVLLAIWFAILALAALSKAVKDLRNGQVKRGFATITKSEEPRRYRLHNLRWFLLALFFLCVSMSFLTEPRPFASPGINAVASFVFFLLTGTILAEAARFSVVPDVYDSMATRKEQPLTFWYQIAYATLGLVLSFGAFLFSLKSLFGSIE